MRRVIKFRAWDKLKRGMVDAPSWDLNAILDPACGYEVMQFTGLLDKNGKEIYEGDVVEYEINAPWDVQQILQVQSRVEWRGVEWWLDNEKGSDACGALDQFGSMEVIGNIYENPDLLKP